MAVVLYDWGPSPFCLKVRALLEYKGVDYRRVNVLGPAYIEVHRRGKIGKVPALDWDGHFVCDSTDIAHFVDARVREPALLPDGARQRALCHALEDWADESLYFLGIYFQWQHEEGRAMVPHAFGRGPLGRIAFRFYDSRLRRQLRGQGIGRKSDSHNELDLERNLDAARDLVVDAPFILGDRPYLCDFAVAAQLLYIGRTPVGERALQSRAEIRDYLTRMRALRAESARAA